MKIFFLCRRYIESEAWTNRVLAYAKGFSELGQNVVLAYLIGDKRRTKYTIPISGVEILDLWKNDGWLAKKCRSLSFFLNLIISRRYINDGDVVFVYGYSSLLLLSVLIIRKKIRVVCEITEHPYKDDVNGDFRRLPFFMHRLLNRIDVLLVISHNLKNYFVSKGIDAKKTHVVNMFVDASRFNRIVSYPKEKYIAYCGIVSLYKDGVNVLIKAFSILHKKYTDYKLYILGRFDSPETESKLKELIKKEQLNESVVFTGRVSFEDMPLYLCNAEVLALARPDNIQSKYGFPTKLGEYLSTGNPVVVTKVGEIPFFLKHKENALLSKPNDENDFADNLIWAIENKHEAKIIGSRGRLLAESDFSYIKQSEKVLNILGV